MPLQICSYNSTSKDENRVEDYLKKHTNQNPEISEIHEQLIDLYLNVKVRKNEEIEEYASADYLEEREALKEDQVTIQILIQYI
jgi:predicted small metal-binding protein